MSLCSITHKLPKKMRALIKRILKLNRKKLLIYLLISLLFSFMFVAMYPSILEQSAELESLFNAYPPAMLEIFDIQGSAIFSEFHAFLGVEYYSIMWPILVATLGISLGTSAIAKEIEDGSLYVLLSQPLSRIKIFIGKYLSGFALISLFVYGSAFVLKFLTWVYEVQWSMESLWSIANLGLLFSLTIFSITFLASSVVSKAGKASSIAAGIVFGGYALNIAARLQDSLDWLKYFSIFHYFDYAKALAGGGIDTANIAVFIGIIVFTFVAGMILFRKRDIAV